jgi:hypothetical protein
VPCRSRHTPIPPVLGCLVLVLRPVKSLRPVKTNARLRRASRPDYAVLDLLPVQFWTFSCVYPELGGRWLPGRHSVSGWTNGARFPVGSVDTHHRRMRASAGDAGPGWRSRPLARSVRVETLPSRRRPRKTRSSDPGIAVGRGIASAGDGRTA